MHRSRNADPAQPTFPKARTELSTNVRLTLTTTVTQTVVASASITLANFTVQPITNDRFLLVSRRCYYRENGPEHNALICDVEGNTLLTACLGDGISHVRTTQEGDIWVGYFDEGVYGNYGWGPTTAEPIGSPGIVRFDRELVQKWALPYDNALGTIDDCYALNVEGETAHAYYYSAFPIVSIVDGVVSGWSSAIAGAHSLIVGDGDACLVGGYGEKDRLSRGQLDSDRFDVTDTKRLVMPDGS